MAGRSSVPLKTKTNRVTIAAAENRHAKITTVDQTGVYDMMGRLIDFSNHSTNMNTLIPVNFNASSVYVIRVKVQNQVSTYKGVLINPGFKR